MVFNNFINGIMKTKCISTTKKAPEMFTWVNLHTDVIIRNLWGHTVTHLMHRSAKLKARPMR